MDIFINEEKLEFSLQERTNLKDILKHIQEWADPDNLFILDYSVNGERNELNPEDVYSESIEKLDIQLGSQADLVFSHVEELSQYINTAGDHIAKIIEGSSTVDDKVSDDNKNNDTIIDDMREGFLWVCESAETLEKYFTNNPVSVYIERLKEQTEDIATNKTQILEVLIALRNTVQIWRKFAFLNQLPPEELNNMYQQYISESSQKIIVLEEIAINFTAGNEKEALHTLDDIMEWLSDYLFLMSKTGKQKDQIDTVGSIMTELKESLETSDYVTLADLLDFDLKDLLTDIRDSESAA